MGDSPIVADLGHLGDRLARLRRLADVTQEGLAERSGVSVDVIRKLEQRRKHSARLPTLHKLATGLGVEVTGLLGDPPALSKVEAESPALVAVRRAIMPSPLAAAQEPDGAEPLSLGLLKAEIAEGWTLYHAAEFGQLTHALPGIIEDARLAVAVGRGEQRSKAHAALGKALQLGGHLAIRLGKTDLALSSLERALLAADSAEDPLLAPMVANSVAQHGRPEQALALGRGIRLSGDTPPSWRTWLLLDVARACTDVGDAAGAVKALESLYRRSPQWMRHHILAVAIVRDLWASPARPPGLRRLAEFLNVIG